MIKVGTIQTQLTLSDVMFANYGTGYLFGLKSDTRVSEFLVLRPT